jgi:hypothetical protein
MGTPHNINIFFIKSSNRSLLICVDLKSKKAKSALHNE